MEREGECGTDNNKGSTTRNNDKEQIRSGGGATAISGQNNN